MTALDVLPLEKAKRHLNIPLATTTDDAELVEFIEAAVARVDRHLFTGPERDTGRSLGDGNEPVTPLRLLAVKAVLAEYWRTQRVRSARGGGGTSAAVIEQNSGPGGMASLRARLTDLLGPPVPDDNPTASAAGAPRGDFPAPQPWPDPARTRWPS